MLQYQMNAKLTNRIMISRIWTWGLQNMKEYWPLYLQCPIMKIQVFWYVMLCYV